MEALRRRIEAEIKGAMPGILHRARKVTRLPSFLPATHFAPPAAEARKMYRMGYFYGAIMVTQATAEALARFIAQCKGMPEAYYCERDERNGGVSQAARLEDLKQQKKISPKAFKHFRRILEHKRNSFHHMDSDVPIEGQRLEAMAYECIESLYSIEGAFLGVATGGRVRVEDHELWSVDREGKVTAFIDCTQI
jgi:hypothetical protein